MSLVKNPLVVIDTNVWVSGIIWHGSPYDVVGHAKSHSIIPVFSSDTFDEFERVLYRMAISVGQIDLAQTAIKNAKEFSAFFEPRTKITQSRDPHDDMFLDICVASKSQFLITGDEDLLTLKTIESTKIVTPSQFLKQSNLF